MEGEPPPLIVSDDEAEAFVELADLSGYDLSTLMPTRFAIVGGVTAGNEA